MTDSKKYIVGSDPEKDAWLTNFFTENHLEYDAFPDMVASPEQLNFIVHMDSDNFYYPCSDTLFEAIIERKADKVLKTVYTEIWNRLEKFVHDVIEKEYERRYLLSLLFIKYQHETASNVMLPARLEKRLLGIFRTISEISRPMAKEFEQENRRVADLLRSHEIQEALDSIEGLHICDSASLEDIDFQIHLIRLQRLFNLSTMWELSENDVPPDFKSIKKMMNLPIESEGWQWFCDWLRGVLFGKNKPFVLWISGHSGEIIFDLTIINLLMKLGLTVILTVKQSFCFNKVSFMDVLEDPVLERLLAGAELIGDPKISKNELLLRLQKDSRLLVISDGTGESFNPLLTSVTFARAFKEADLVINRCQSSQECINNRFKFTRDLVSIYKEDNNSITVSHYPPHPATIRFTEQMLRAKAEDLIQIARTERDLGKTIVFYSAIVGSIPGQLDMAKKILKVFISYLRSTQPFALIINPGEHFEEGMDADDIMYMWEIFQRSGMIDIWRFQTVADVEKAFELMGEKVPPGWMGKDSTYSTGCTKEMEIALDMQKRNPEMQIIGPSWEKFLRRKEYGVGKFYDRALADYE